MAVAIQSAQHHPRFAAMAAPFRLSAVWLLAIALSLILTACRAALQWHQLSLLRLPDNDDMMRLAEIRDWIAGQNFHDLMQHRLGLPPAGASMHWSRIADVGPAVLLLVFQPILGPSAAALAMVIVYQALLLLAYLMLAARNAFLLAGRRAMVPEVILAALAFPTIGLFAPGRIDHHALQIVLSMVVVGAFISPPSLRAGLFAGIAAALSLGIGLEVAPELIVGFAVIGVQWLFGGRREDLRLAGLAIALGLTTLMLLWFARPIIWPKQWCDGFTPASSYATLGASVALGVLAAAGRCSSAVTARACAAAVAAMGTLAWAWHSSRVCLNGPYGALDPFLKRVFMNNVGEARGLVFDQNGWGTAIAYGGLAFAAVAVLAVFWMRDPILRRRAWPLAAFIALSAVTMIFQIRVSYILGGVASLPFSALMVRAEVQNWGLGRRLAIWLGGAGITYNLLGLSAYQLLTPAPQRIAANKARECLDGPPLVELAGMRPGNVMAPLDSGAYVIGMTPHRSFAAPYHRNNAGNMAMYRFFLSPAPHARAMARALNVNYVVVCRDSITEDQVLVLRRGTLVEDLENGRVPVWLRRVAGNGNMAVYRVL